MATQGLLTLLTGFNQTQFKIVTGCDGGSNMESLGRALLKQNAKRFSVEWLRNFALHHCGCEDCLFVVDKESIYPHSEDDLSLYRSTFDCPHFNPRWGCGLADQIWLMRHDQKKLMPWIDPTWSIFDNGTFGMIGNTLRPVSGVTFDLANPKPSMVRIKDIAHALARVCRFGGHINAEWYSVAEHSINCWLRSVEHGADVEAQLAVLMHDSAEYVVSDCIKPLKVMMPYYSWIEERIEAAIAEKWNIDFEGHHEMIKRCDHEMLVAEKQVFITNAETFVFEGQERIEAFPFSPETLSPELAASKFEIVFRDLIKERSKAAV